MKIRFLILLFAVACGARVLADEATLAPLVAALVRDGVPVTDGQTQKLSPPVVTLGMTADDQRRAVEQLVGRSRVKPFLRNSVVARHQLDVPTLGKLEDGSTVRGVDLAFVVYADLDLLREQGFAESPTNGGPASPPRSKFESYFEPLAGRPAAGVDNLIAWAEKSRLYRYRFPLLDKVVVAGLLRGQTMLRDGLFVQTIVSPVDQLANADWPTIWRAIPRDAAGDAQLGPAAPFRGLAAYMQATELKFQPGALLVELHAVYVEPQGWFGGRNLLASKLPLALQDAVRKFRRELAKHKTEGSPP